ncbi:MAG: helix-hairpin-helix domain-containing protein [Clostridia bacterium]|nr:helix-hairpin-helix domain-containing protein [Clostridia bacterium]
MKNFKKIIFLSIGIIIIVIYLVYNYSKDNASEILEENIYIETSNETKEKNKIILHITGEVNFPGIIEIEEGSRLANAIEAAGGLTENADINKINLAYVVKDGQKINIPNVNSVDTSSYITEDIGENIIIEDINSNTNLVNINTATQTELETLTGIGPSTALKIIKYREENGKFTTIEDIKNVPGIGDSKFESIKEEICV